MNTINKIKTTSFTPIGAVINNKHNKKPLITLMRKKGTTCCKCGAVALELVKYKYSSKSGRHVNSSGIYGINTDGKYVQFTIDHIIPKSKCPKGTTNNLQVMCYDCNQKKANTFVGENEINKLVQYQNSIRKFASYLCGLIEKIIKIKTNRLLLKRNKYASKNR
ncbi:MAG: HNH endonuclease [Novosphingobium sp.]|nr:HNH endonuclease [Novosphingobium sp.]